MNTTDIGRSAEKEVAALLENQGHRIISLNWRNRWCEIDIISTKKRTVYFTEVKYRSETSWGSGFDYITPRKVKQMQFAAEFWLHEHAWKGDVELQAAEVDVMMQIQIVSM